METCKRTDKETICVNIFLLSGYPIKALTCQEYRALLEGNPSA
jgi:hypothetical protein